MKTIGIDKFSKRLDEIFEQGSPTKAQIIDAYNKSAFGVLSQLPANEIEINYDVKTNIRLYKGAYAITFTIGVQTFTIDYHPTDIKEAKWMTEQIHTAFDNYEEHICDQIEQKGKTK
jgi:hypothetical protein